MMFRPQRGSVEDSMRDRVMLLSSIDALAKHLAVSRERIRVTPYWDYDARTGWPTTYLVTVDGFGVGFVNQEIR